jgi:hypothetical protein
MIISLSLDDADHDEMAQVSGSHSLLIVNILGAASKPNLVGLFLVVARLR